MYEAQKKDIEGILDSGTEAKIQELPTRPQARRHGGNDDMDVDAFDTGKEQWGGPGSGKGGHKLDETLFNTGKAGHQAADCWSKWWSLHSGGKGQDKSSSVCWWWKVALAEERAKGKAKPKTRKGKSNSTPTSMHQPSNLWKVRVDVMSLVPEVLEFPQRLWRFGNRQRRCWSKLSSDIGAVLTAFPKSFAAVAVGSDAEYRTSAAQRAFFSPWLAFLLCGAHLWVAVAKSPLASSSVLHVALQSMCSLIWAALHRSLQ